LRLHPDRALPLADRQLAVAREIYSQTAVLGS
jgi:hypothetical protein